MRQKQKSARLEEQSVRIEPHPREQARSLFAYPALPEPAPRGYIVKSEASRSRTNLCRLLQTDSAI